MKNMELVLKGAKKLKKYAIIDLAMEPTEKALQRGYFNEKGLTPRGKAYIRRLLSPDG